MEESFDPKPWTRNPHLQSMLASSTIRALGRNQMAICAREMIVDGGNGVRLLGFHSLRPGGTGKALVLLIHGWEGGADSTYMLHTGKYLFNRGYDIFRLNLRDHGDSHHLNEGLFHGALIDEAFTATQNISSLSKEKPFFIVGFSLGGNFALRIAMKQKASPFENLKHVICISPLLDPYKTTLAIDNGFLMYRYYFLRKWKASLKKKQNLFPGIYNFDEAYSMKSILRITDYFVRKYSDFGDHRDYFNHYTLLDDTFSDLSQPVTVFASLDDPVIPASDYNTLKTNHNMRVSLQKYGGHCGFIDHPFPFGCWYERRILELLRREASGKQT